MTTPSARSLATFKPYMPADVFAAYERGELGVYGGDGLAPGVPVPAGLALFRADETPVCVSELGSGARPAVLNFGSCS